MTIAVTGAIGSGKSMVARELVSRLQAEHCDTDEICRKLMEKGQEGWRRAVSQWGGRYQTQDGDIDRAKLREAIFNDEVVRRELEAILHPLVSHYLIGKMNNAAGNSRMLVVEIPLLFETGWSDRFEAVVAVTAPREQCIERVMRRDGVAASQVAKALDAQMDIAEKAKLADYVIDNGGPLQKTLPQIEELCLKFRR